MSGCRSGKEPTVHDIAKVAEFAELLSALRPPRHDADGRRLIDRVEAAALVKFHADDPEIAARYQHLADGGDR